MPSRVEQIEFVKSILLKYESCDVGSKGGERRFIKPLGKGKLSYLHKLFKGCDERELRRLERIIGFPLPDDYQMFMALSDGAICFDNTLVIYGLKSNMDRSLEIEGQGPLSLENEVNLWRDVGRPDGVPVGSVSAATLNFIIEMYGSGYVRFGNDSRGYRGFTSFLECLQTLFSIIDNISNENGLIDDSGYELEKDLLALLSR